MRQIIIPLQRPLVADDSIYGVRVRAAETTDGKWEGRVEFESKSGIRVTTLPESTHATRTEVEAWAGRLEDPYLVEALRRASERLIRRVIPPPPPVD
ncbi:MAG TPA: hypothetical protein VMS98_10420 [Thermoanaerobaculia bacterium]|nr:hypothetical protein [Thermoanaerobaculia bacterium]